MFSFFSFFFFFFLILRCFRPLSHDPVVKAEKLAKADVDETTNEKEVKEEKKERTASKPPLKRMRDDAFRNRFDKDRSHSVPSRGREFVRGRGRSRGRGRGGFNSRGRSDFRSYDRRLQPPDHKPNKYAPNKWQEKQTIESEHSEGEVEVELSKRRRGRDEESDVSVDETSGTTSESCSERTSEARDLLHGKDEEGGNDLIKDKVPREELERKPTAKDSKEEKLKPNVWKEKKDDKLKEKNDRNEKDPHRDDSKNFKGKPSTAFVPRGEPSRRGRGKLSFC